jgi:hypothetical protein
MKQISLFIFLMCVMLKCIAQDLRITEVMYNPSNTDSSWEWVEVYNAGTELVDLNGYVIDDNSGAEYTESNITSGTILPGESVVMFNGASLSEAEFSQVWGTVNLVSVTRWSALNNGGDSIGIWNNFQSYLNDNVAQENTIEQLTYDDDGQVWPKDDGFASIYLLDLEADNNLGTNWSLSISGANTPLFKAYTSKVFETNDGQDIGSPGLSSIADSEKPEITCPDTVEMIAEADNCGAKFPIVLPTATDNISSEFEFEGIRNDGLALIDFFPVGETIINWTAIDEAGNISESCEQIVRIIDEVLPVLNCPEAIIVSSEDGNSVIIEIEFATASDTCGGELALSFTRSDDLGLQEPFPIGVTIINWKVLDEARNVSECEQIITVNFIGSPENAFTAFSISNQLGESAIDNVNKMVNLKVPFGTNITALIPSIEISDGASVSPAKGAIQDFTTSVAYTVTAEDETEQIWIVTIEIEEEEEVVEENQLIITSFVLVNADTNEDLFPLEEGMQINRRDLPTLNLDIRANTSEDVESVRLSLSGDQITARTESLIPYALFQDLPIGNYKGNEFALGTYEVSAIAYAADGLKGKMGAPLTLNFEIVDFCESLEVSLEIFEDLQDTENPIVLSGGLPEGGIYSGEGVVDGIFDPSIGEGIYDITYNYVDVITGCEGSVTESLMVLSTIILKVESFTLINADTNEDLFEIEEGMVIDINSLPTNHLDIRANTTNDVESVKLSLSGSQVSARTESLKPYALFQDLPIGNYKGNNFTTGKYSVIGVPYAEDNARGNLGSSFRINFELVDANLQIIDFTLVNAETNEDIFQITDGMVIDINALPTLNLDIRANTSSDVESVIMSITGALNSSRTESLVPYVLFQDLPIGDYKGSPFQIGMYSVTGETFSENNGRGKQGMNLTINFELIDPIVIIGSSKSNSVVLSPNPALHKTRLSFENKVEIRSIAIHDNLGRVVLTFAGKEVEEVNDYILQISSLPFGVYFVKAQDIEGNYYSSQLIVSKK